MEFNPSKLSWTKEQLVEALKTATSLLNLEHQLGLSGNNSETIKKYAEVWGIDLSVINANPKKSVLKLSDSQIFIENSQIATSTLRARISKNKLLEYSCAKCKEKQSPLNVQEGVAYWHNEPLTLQIDHINGNASDNRLENLRYLCPNCHSQTKTFSGKNAYKNLSEDRIEAIKENNPLTSIISNEYPCDYCGEIFKRTRQNLYFCSVKCSANFDKTRLYKGKDKISKDELAKAIWEKPVTEIAKQLGVSDKAVKKWCIQYGIETPGRGYWAKKYARKPSD